MNQHRFTPCDCPKALFPLADKPTWVNWKFGGDKKIPYQPNKSGLMAKANNPQTWGTFAEAAARMQPYDAERAARALEGGYDPLAHVRGIGFMHCPNHNVVTVDIDAKKVEGPSDPRYRWLLDLYDSLWTYAETSPSGRGCHVMGLIHGAAGDEIISRIDGEVTGVRGCVDLFCDVGYVTITGAACRGDLPILDISEPLLAFLRTEDIKPKPSVGEAANVDYAMTEDEAFKLCYLSDRFFYATITTPVETGQHAFSRAVWHLCKIMKPRGVPRSLAYRILETSALVQRSEVERGRETRAKKLSRIFDKSWSKA